MRDTRLRLYLYCTVVTDDDGDALDWGMVQTRFLRRDLAEADVVKFLQERFESLGSFNFADPISVRLYPTQPRSDAGVLGSDSTRPIATVSVASRSGRG